MAGLSLGRPIVSTRGRLTEAVWDERGAVLLADVGDRATWVQQVERLLDDPAERQRLGSRGHRLYEERFDLRHTVDALRSAHSTHPLEGRAS